MNDTLSKDTQATLLLCGVLGKGVAVKPLMPREYAALVRWLIKENLRPSDLLFRDEAVAAACGAGIDEQRLEGLLGRGVQLGFAVEEWQRNGIWVLGRSDGDYPERYKKHLKDKAPSLLFGVGKRSLLAGGGLCVVGSRHVDAAGENFARSVAQWCAYNQMPLVSGGARGVDQIAMTGALGAGGVGIGVLAENLLRKSVEREARHALAEGRLVLLSPYHPQATFSVGAAMGRNKLIYAMADMGLVVSAEYARGGTWAGAAEELQRETALPVFVRCGDTVPQGNDKLLELGAMPWPEVIEAQRPWQQVFDLATQHKKQTAAQSQALFDVPEVLISRQECPRGAAVLPCLVMAKDTVAAAAQTVLQISPQASLQASIYDAVLPLILEALTRPMCADELAKVLDVNKAQLGAWLKKAAQESRVVKLANPVRYKKAVQEDKSLSLLSLAE